MHRRQFIKSVGWTSLLLGVSPLFSFSNDLLESLNNDELKEQGLIAFERFKEIWNFNDFWKRGNTFDACLCLVGTMVQKWPNDPKVKQVQLSVKDMLVENLQYFNRFDPGGLWADDFGWWGLMGLNARKHLLNLGDKDLADQYLKLSLEKCWEYKKSTAYDSTNDALPVPHGCRNGDAKGESRGVKNTVTNVLLFLLSSRIYKLTLTEHIEDNDKYLEMAYKQWIWFDTWFSLGKYHYLKRINSNAALVQERPMAFFEGSDYTSKIHPPWAEGWTWSGDQGMILAALSDMLSVKQELQNWINKNNIDQGFTISAFEKKIRSYIELIANGVKVGLVGADDVFREAPCLSSFGPQHGNDYLAGRGILMRYIGSKELKNISKIDFKSTVLSTVNAIWETRDNATNQFQPVFTKPENDKRYIEHFKSLWGTADETLTWSIEKMDEQQKMGVCQSIGLDALAAAIKLSV